MTLKADILTDLDDVFYETDEFAETVSYTASGENAASVTIIREEQDPSIMSDAPPGARHGICRRTSASTEEKRA
ncbi:MAG: hypothetical protein JRC60_07610 [Deltaproteobacteria bacterium]|nr:hypothetical protein [Deltaproteobacteria bacterium]